MINKKLILLVVFVVAFSGCATQRGVNFEFTSTGDLIVVGEKNLVLSDGELVGEHCTVNMQDGTVLKGVIFAISQTDVSIGRDRDDSVIEDTNPIFVAVGKNEIDFLTLTHEKAAGFSSGDLTVLLVLVPVALLFWFVTTYESPWQ